MRYFLVAVTALMSGCTSPEPEPSVSEAGSQPGREPSPATDPARVVGRWAYRTQSNCGSVDGVGELIFDWDASQPAYRERGCVYWSDSGNTIYWWGHPQFVSETRRLEGRNQNSLGDYVDGGWTLEGQGPDRLVVTWTQTNGCRGQGIATRGSAPTPSMAGAAFEVVLAWLDEREGEGSSPCDATKAGPTMWPGPRDD